jgi:capsular polysaccharide biosynthesis protein
VGDMTSATVPGVETTSLDDAVSEGYLGPMVDLRALKEGVRRRRRFWFATAALGLFVGAALHLVVPAKYTAVAHLYMVEPSSMDPAVAMANDVSLLETRAVTDQALSALHLRINPTNFLATYSGTQVSDSILSVKLSAPSSADAVRYDNAVAQAFLSVRSGVLGLQTKLIVDGLENQIGSLNANISQLTGQINALSTAQAEQQSANQLTALVNERSGDVSQISQLQSQVQQDELAERSVAQGSEVLDPAEAVKVSVKKVIAVDGLSGLVAGLALGLGIVVVGEAISDRPRRRGDVAAALGTPVELSVGRYRKSRWPRRMRLRRRLKVRQPPLPLLERKLRAELDGMPGSSLVVVAVEALELAALSVAALALSLADEGKRVVLADMAEGSPLARLLGAKPGPMRAVTYAGRSLSVVVASDDPTQTDRSGLRDADVVLVLASITPDLGADHLTSWAHSAVVMVTAGRASVARLNATRQMLDHAALGVSSTVLIGAGAEDESVGSVSSRRLPSENSADLVGSGWEDESFSVPLHPQRAGSSLASERGDNIEAGNAIAIVFEEYNNGVRPVALDECDTK